MVGRPRKQNVRRYISGKVANDPAGTEAPPPAMVKRATLMSMIGLAAPEYGTMLGLYFLQRKIDAHAYEAGKRFAELHRNYAGCVAGPKPPSSVSMEGGSRQAAIDPDSDAGEREAVRHRDVLMRYHDAHTALRMAGNGVERIVVQFCDGVGQSPAGHEELLRLRNGLDALVVLWKIRGRK